MGQEVAVVTDPLKYVPRADLRWAVLFNPVTAPTTSRITDALRGLAAAV